MRLSADEQSRLVGLVAGCRGGLEELKGIVGASLLEVMDDPGAAFGGESRRVKWDEQSYEQ